MITINRKPNENLEKFLRRFKKACIVTGLNHEIKRKQYHITESEKHNIKNSTIKFNNKKNRERAARLKLKKNMIKRHGNR